MMRIGPWVLGAGLAMLAAGVVSTRADAWNTRLPAVTIPLTLAGIDTIDIREGGIDKVVISDKLPPQVHYSGESNTRWRRNDRPPAPPACRVQDGVLRCTAGPRGWSDGGTVMQLPPGRYRLLTRDVRISAESNVEWFAVEAVGRVNWAGPAGELEVTLPPLHRESGKSGYCDSSSFDFESGRVGALRVRAAAGSVSFGDLSDVGKIDVEAASDTGLSVKRAGDIARIAVHPLSSALGTMDAIDCAIARAAME